MLIHGDMALYRKASKVELQQMHVIEICNYKPLLVELDTGCKTLLQKIKWTI